MSVTADVLMAVCRKAAGDTARAVSFREIGGAAGLTIDELRSAVRVLEQAGLLVRESNGYDASATVRITAAGVSRCKKSLVLRKLS